MRSLFIILRSVSYAANLVVLFINKPDPTWLQWAVSFVIIGWNSWDQWKKPDDPVFRLRVGVWLETAFIILWVIVMQDGALLFMLLSPLMRSCIHLRLADIFVLFAVQTAAACLLYQALLIEPFWLFILLGTLFSVGMYSLVIGLLLKQRDQARRNMALTAFERDQLSRDQERTRIAGQLHDVMGQHWTSIVRALDVALATQGEQSKQFIVRAQETARQGLQDMRSAVHDWQDGRQTPHQWMDYLQKSAIQFRELTGVKVVFELTDLDWNRFDNPTYTAELLVRSGIEAMTNAVRHGEATTIQLTIKQRDEDIEMTVHDDGKGITSLLDPSGTGLSSMKKHVESLRGKWELLSEKGSGTRIKLSVPYHIQGVDSI